MRNTHTTTKWYYSLHRISSILTDSNVSSKELIVITRGCKTLLHNLTQETLQDFFQRHLRARNQRFSSGTNHIAKRKLREWDVKCVCQCEMVTVHTISILPTELKIRGLWSPRDSCLVTKRVLRCPFIRLATLLRNKPMHLFRCCFKRISFLEFLGNVWLCSWITSTHTLLAFQ